MPLVRKKNQPMISQIFGLDNTTVEATSFLPEITCTGLYISLLVCCNNQAQIRT